MRFPISRRGCYPAISKQTMTQWPFDNTSGSVQHDVKGAHLTAQAASLAIPTTTTLSPAGGALVAATASKVLRSGLLSADEIAQAIGPVTVHAMVWIDPAQGNSKGVWGAITGSTTATAVNNTLIMLGMINGRIHVEWQQGTAVSVVYGPAGYTLPVAKWILVSIVRTPLTSTTCMVDVYINGVRFSSSGSLTSPNGGSTTVTRYHFFSYINSTATAFTSPFLGRIAFMHFEARAQSADEVADVFWRAALWKTPSEVGHRVRVEDSTGAIVDLRDMLGADFTVDAAVNTTNDGPTASAAVQIRREVGDLSLAPFNTSSRMNRADRNDFTSTLGTLIDVGRDFFVDYARTPLWIDPSSSDWTPIFEGVIDEVDMSDDPIKIDGRDRGGTELVDRFIQDERLIASNDIYQVIGDVLYSSGTGYAGDVDIIPVAGPSPGFIVNEYTQAEGPLMEALRTLAQLPGWDFRYLFRQLDNTFVATFFEIPRTRAYRDALIPDEMITGYSRISIALDDVRTACRVVFPNANNLDTDGNKLPGEVYVQSSPAIRAKYPPDPRFMGFSEKQTSQLDTTTKATNFANAALSDMQEPNALFSLDLMSLPELELYDYPRLAANRRRYTLAQDIGLTAVRNSFDVEGGGTSIDARGSPSAGVEKYLEMETGRGGEQTVVRTIDGMITTKVIGAIRPGLVAAIELSSMLRGLTHNALVYNGTFTRSMRGLGAGTFYYLPDGWELETGGTKISNTSSPSPYVDSTGWQTGDRGLYFSGGIVPETIVSKMFAVGPRRCLGVEAVLMSASFVEGLGFSIAWYDGDKALISNSATITLTPLVLGAFSRKRVVAGNTAFSPPTNARWAKLRILRATAPSGDIWLDEVQAYEVSPEAAMRRLTSAQTGIPKTGAFTIVQLNSVVRDLTPAASPSADKTNFVINIVEDGNYQLFGSIVCKATGTSAPVATIGSATARITHSINGGAYTEIARGASSASFEASGSFGQLAVAPVTFEGQFRAGDRVRLEGSIAGGTAGGGTNTVSFEADARTTFVAKMKQE